MLLERVEAYFNVLICPGPNSKPGPLAKKAEMTGYSIAVMKMYICGNITYTNM
jgi:hypothetical protein